jgi:hypothetical protein
MKSGVPSCALLCASAVACSGQTAHFGTNSNRVIAEFGAVTSTRAHRGMASARITF